jgi:DNA mismatch repair protein MutL
MGRIKILDENVVNHIAAGEVIERPASVVKELVENSLDAGANQITINIENGGKKLIQVADDGSGMARDDALLAIKPHATSKIYTISDISNITTLGFRGEALASIAAVAELELITLPQNMPDSPATQITIQDGKIDKISEVASTPGTIVKVRNLFQNVPARKKFLKTQTTEMRHIIRAAQRLACVHFETGFRLLHNGRESLNYPKVDILEKRIADIFGSSFFQQNIIPLQRETAQIQIQGYIGAFDVDYEWGDTHLLFINGRYINDKIVYSAIRKAYEPFIKKSIKSSQLPLYLLFLNISNDKIDFNVSPTKSEVRFDNSQMVFNFIKDTITDALLVYEGQKYESISKSSQEKLSGQTGAPAGAFGNSNKGLDKKRFFSRPDRDETWKELDAIFPQRKKDAKSMPDQEDMFINKKKDVQLVSFFDEEIVKDKNKLIETEMVNPWQAGNLFIFVGMKSGVIAIDQHAAHERILYEKILQQLEKSQTSARQRLLFPFVLDLPKHLQKIIPELVEEHIDLFNNIGFKLKIFSGNSIIVEEIPKDIHDWNSGQVLINIFEQLEESLEPQVDFKEKLASAYACHAAIKAGQRLTKREMLALINDLFACKNPFFCPHGRPTIIEIPFDELEKRFKRV